MLDIIAIPTVENSLSIVTLPSSGNAINFSRAAVSPRCTGYGRGDGASTAAAAQAQADQDALVDGAVRVLDQVPLPSLKKMGAQLASLPEGDLSRVRANLVKQDTLHQVAKTLDLSSVMRLGEGEMRSGGQNRPSILADALEAIIGAVYLDGGYKDAQALVERLFAQVDIKPDMQAVGKDPKTELQEWLQGRKLALPKYTVVGTSGAAHRQQFEVSCEVTELRQTQQGSGASRRAAEQAAAAAMLLTLKSESAA